MAPLHTASPVAKKQRAERPNARKASVTARPPERTEFQQKRRGRPCNSAILPRIARAEAFVEAIVALKDCAQIERRAGATLAYNEHTRRKIELLFSRGAITFSDFASHMHALDKIEVRLAVRLVRHADRVDERAIPEAQRGYQAAESAA